VFKFGTCRTAAMITLHVRSDPRHLIIYGIFDDTVHRWDYAGWRSADWHFLTHDILHNIESDKYTRKQDYAG